MIKNYMFCGIVLGAVIITVISLIHISNSFTTIHDNVNDTRDLYLEEAIDDHSLDSSIVYSDYTGHYTSKENYKLSLNNIHNYKGNIDLELNNDISFSGFEIVFVGNVGKFSGLSLSNKEINGSLVLYKDCIELLIDGIDKVIFDK